MASDAVFFFRIGFLSGKIPGVSSRVGGGDVLELAGVSMWERCVLSGPYNHVTSQSFNLRHKS